MTTYIKIGFVDTKLLYRQTLKTYFYFKGLIGVKYSVIFYYLCIT
jgi:hypothetical protein